MSASRAVVLLHGLFDPAANVAYVDQLEEQDLILPDTKAIYARGLMLGPSNHYRRPLALPTPNQHYNRWVDRGIVRSHLRIGELAGELGLNPKTIRYYEAIGLLPVPPRTRAGYRLYGAGDRDRLRFIAKAKAVGLTLEEIGDILALRDRGTEPCPRVRELLDQKLAAVDEQLRALADLRAELLSLRTEAESVDGSDAPICGVIERHEAVRRG